MANENIQVIAKVKGKPDVQLVNQPFTSDIDVELVKILDGAAASMYHEVLSPTTTPPVPPQPPEPPLPPTVTGIPDLTGAILLFDSTKIWANGHERTMVDHHEFDPDDKSTEVAAGGHGTPRKWYVSGKGWSTLSGGMSRVYNHSQHDKKILIVQTFIFNGSLKNMSYECFSRHNEGGDIANRTGGLQMHFALTEFGAKFESYHASYHDVIKDKPYPDGKKIKAGDEVRVAILATKDGTKYTIRGLIDWDKNGKYVEVGSGTHNETENPKGCEKQPLYWRWRVNGDAPKDVKAWDTKFYQLA